MVTIKAILIFAAILWTFLPVIVIIMYPIAQKAERAYKKKYISEIMLSDIFFCDVNTRAIYETPIAYMDCKTKKNIKRVA